MNITIADNFEQMSQQAALALRKALQGFSCPLLCAASGATPTRTYQIFAEQLQSQEMLRKSLRVIKLDEWGGISMDSPASCEAHLQGVLIQPLDLQDRYIAFQSQPQDATQECQRISAWLQTEGPIDVCVLGLGLNGHLGFNEPAPQLSAGAHIANLSPTSLNHAMLEADSERPQFGLTLGMRDLFQAKQILVLVSGTTKQVPLRQMLSGPLTTQFPASWLQLHPHVDLFCDRSAWGSSPAP